MSARTLLMLPLLLSLQTPTRDAASLAPPTGTASLAGTLVTDDTSTQPIRKARVTLKSTDDAVGLTTTTDENGRFLFRDLPARRYVLQASKAAWLTTTYGARRPGRPGTPIAVADGQRVIGITLKMSRGAVVTGTVRDQLGQPAAGVRIEICRFAMQNGERVLEGFPLPPVTTDDTGTYRVFGLPPGDVVLMASPRSASGIMTSDSGDFRPITAGDVTRATQLVRQDGVVSGSQPAMVLSPPVKPANVFYPGTTDPAAAAVLTLTAGEERTGVDFALQVVPTGRVSGVVIGIDGTPQPRAMVIALSGVMTALGVGAASLSVESTNEKGEYNLGGLPPGPFMIVAAGAGWTRAEIDVNGQDVNVPLRLQPLLSLRGRINFDGEPRPATTAGLRLSLRGIGEFSTFVSQVVNANAVTVQDSTFAIAELMPGTFRFVFSGVPAGWYVKSAIVNGRDVLDGVLEIQPQDRVTEVALTLTNRPSELAGSLRDATGGAAPDYFIIVFSADRAHWAASSRRILQTRPANDGAFTLKGMPAGDYYIAALTDVEPGEWFSPAFLESVVGAAVKVTIVEGQRTVQDLEIRKF